MYRILACIYFGFFSGVVNGSLKDYAFEFPNKGVTDFVQLWNKRSLEQFTVCFWMQSTDASGGTPFSYSVPGADNELVIANYSNFTVWIGNEKRHLSASASDGKWHHICVSWENTAGSLNFYKEGVLFASERNFKTGHTIRSGGSVMLGQDQAGGLDSAKSFQGFLSNLNVWDYVLCQEIITRMSKACLNGEGNVYKWSYFKHGIKGDPRLFVPSPCTPPELIVKDANWCKSSPCMNNGTCSVHGDGFNCSCPLGYFGERCDEELSIHSDILADNAFFQSHFYNFLEPAVGNHSNWLLCWRASFHGWTAQTFHNFCDGNNHTVTIVKTGQYVFGGYTDIPWDSGSGWSSTSNAFVFSLLNKEDLAPFKSMVAQPQYAIYRYSIYGPIFGTGHEIYISDNSNSNTDSAAKFDDSYVIPSEVQDGISVLAGTSTGNFSPDEVEVFYLG